MYSVEINHKYCKLTPERAARFAACLRRAADNSLVASPYDATTEERQKDIQFLLKLANHIEAQTEGATQ